MKLSDINLTNQQQLLLTGGLGVLGTIVYLCKSKPEVWIPAAYESVVLSSLAVAWTLIPKEQSEISGEMVSKPEKQVIPSFRL